MKTKPPPKKEEENNVMGKLTPTQERIYNLLSDGLPHTKNEVKMCIDPGGDPSLVSDNNMRMAISTLRDKIPDSQEILTQCVNRNTFRIRLVVKYVPGYGE